MATCPKCGSENVNFQREQTASIGGSAHSFKNNSSHGCLWWAFVGWWYIPFKWLCGFMLTICTMGLSLIFRRKKNSVTGKTVTATKIFNRTMAVCQDCGNSWKA